MEISLSKSEYITLLDMLYLADYVINSHLLYPAASNNTHAKLFKKICNYDIQEEYRMFIKLSDDEGYEITKAYEDVLHKNHIEPYERMAFWDHCFLNPLLSSIRSIKIFIRKMFDKDFEPSEYYHHI